MTPTIGRQVHYVAENGQHAPAFIVGFVGSVLALTVLTDGIRDRDTKQSWEPTFFRANVKEDEDGELPGTWHWPERAGAEPTAPAPATLRLSENDIRQIIDERFSARENRLQELLEALEQVVSGGKIPETESPKKVVTLIPAPQFPSGTTPTIQVVEEPTVSDADTAKIEPPKQPE